MAIKRSSFRWMLFIFMVSFIYLVWSFNFHHFLSLQELKHQHQSLVDYSTSHPCLSLSGFILCYILIAGLSLPGAIFLTLAGGMVFGFWLGLFLVSLGSTLGASLAFLISRFLLRDWVQLRFQKQVKKINEGIRKGGIRYLFALRFTPAIPYALVNLGMGVSPISFSTFFWVSFLGMLPANSIYVNAGTQLSQIESLREIFSWDLIGAFTLLGVFPILTQRIIARFKKSPFLLL